MFLLKFLLVLLSGAYSKSDSPPDNVENHRNYHLLPRDVCGEIASYTKEDLLEDRALPGEYPWLVLFNGHILRSPLDAGVLISKDYVISHKYINGATIVRVGDQYTKTEVDCYKEKCFPKYQEIPIQRTIYKEFDKSFDKDVIGDSKFKLSLIRLAHSVKFAENVLPICLQTTNLNSDFISGKTAELCSWKMEKNSFMTKELLYIYPKEANQKAHISDSILLTKSISSFNSANRRGSPLQNIYPLGDTRRYFLEGIQIDDYLKPNDYKYLNIKNYTIWILDNMEE